MDCFGSLNSTKKPNLSQQQQSQQSQQQHQKQINFCCNRNNNAISELLDEKNREIRSKDLIIANLRELIEDQSNEIVYLKNEIDIFKQVVKPLTQKIMVNGRERIKRQAISAEPVREPDDDDSGQLNLLECRKISKPFNSRELIKSAILDNDFLKHLEMCQIREIVDCMYPVDYDAGVIIIREGDIGSSMFVMEEGKVEVSRDEKHLSTIAPGKVLGELAILYDCKRTATIRAVTKCKLWAIERQNFQAIMMRTGLIRQTEYLDFLKSVNTLTRQDVTFQSQISPAHPRIPFVLQGQKIGGSLTRTVRLPQCAGVGGPNGGSLQVSHRVCPVNEFAGAGHEQGDSTQWLVDEPLYEWHIACCKYINAAKAKNVWPLVPVEHEEYSSATATVVWWLEDVATWTPNCNCKEKIFVDGEGFGKLKVGLSSKKESKSGTVLITSHPDLFYQRTSRWNRTTAQWTVHEKSLNVDVSVQANVPFSDPALNAGVAPPSVAKTAPTETQSQPIEPLTHSRVSRRRRRNSAASRSQTASDSMSFNTANGWVKIGDNSIHGAGVVQLDSKLTIVHPKKDMASNAFTTAMDFLNMNTTYVKKDNNMTVTVESMLSLATNKPSIRQARAVASAIGTFPDNNELRNFEVAFFGSAKVETLPPINYEVYVPGGHINTEAIVNGLTAGAAMHHRLAESLALELPASSFRYNNASLYAVGAMLTYQLYMAEASVPEIALVPRAAPAVVHFHYRNVNPDRIPDDLIEAVKDDIYEHALVFVENRYDDKDLVVMQLIASGLPRFDSPAGSRRTMMQYLTTPAIEIRVYGNRERPIPALAVVSASQIWATILKIAEDRGEWEMMSEGVTRAAILLRGFITRTGVEPHQVNRWVTSIFEMETVLWLRPLDWNFMWRWLDIGLAKKPTNASHEEAATMRSMTVPQLFLASHLVAQVVSAFFSTVLMRYNITGLQLNYLVWKNYPIEGCALLMLQLFDRSEYLPSGAVYWILSESLARCSRWRIPPRAFDSVYWCAGRNWSNIPEADADTEYFRNLPGLIPVFGHVPCVSNYIQMWPDTWGYVRPPMVINLDSDRIPGGVAQGAGISASGGEKLYTAFVDGGNNYLYVPYGLMLINAIRQSQNNAQFNVLYEMIKVSSPTYHCVTGRVAFAPNTLEVIPGTVITLPGYLISYDWHTDTVYAPWIPAQNFIAPIWSWISNMRGDTKVGNAGLVTQRSLCTGLFSRLTITDTVTTAGDSKLQEN